MSKKISVLAICVFLMFGCTDSTSQTSSTDQPNTADVVEGKDKVNNVEPVVEQPKVEEVATNTNMPIKATSKTVTLTIEGMT